MKIACPIRTEKGRNIINRARKELLNERISLTSNRINRLRNDTVAKDSNLAAILQVDLKSQVNDLITKSCERMFKTTKDGHREKFEKLLEKSKLPSPGLRFIRKPTTEVGHQHLEIQA